LDTVSWPTWRRAVSTYFLADGTLNVAFLNLDSFDTT